MVVLLRPWSWSWLCRGSVDVVGVQSGTLLHPPQRLLSPPPTRTHPAQVIELNVSTVSADPNKTVDITDLQEVDARFSYSVRWAPTDAGFADRMDRYARYSFLPQHLEASGVALRGGGAVEREGRWWWWWWWYV